MGDGTLALESGGFPDAPRGYQAPSIPPAGGSFPRGWDSAPGPPGSEGPVVLGANQESLLVSPAAQPAPESSTPAVAEGLPQRSDRQSAREFLNRQSPVVGVTQAEVDRAAIDAVATMLSNIEHANLATGLASFMGHTVVLSPQATSDIRGVLAQEVCRQLEEERQRVLDGVQHERMQGEGGSGGADVPSLPGAAPPVDAKAQSGERAMS